MYKNFKIVWPADDSIQATDVSVLLNEETMATIQYSMHLLEENSMMKHIALEVEGVLYEGSNEITCDDFTAMVFSDAVVIHCVVDDDVHFMTNALMLNGKDVLTLEDA